MEPSRTVLAIVFHGKGDVGTARPLLEAAGYALDIRNPIEGDALPASDTRYAGAIIFGGAMSANDDETEGVAASLKWLDGALKAELPVLGICLGAQMIARVAGARVTPHAEGHWEIGYYPVRPVSNGGGPFVEDGAHFYQWHKEGFDLPADAELLAVGATYPNQAFRLGPSAVGVQFHPEVTARLFETWMDASPGFEDRPNAQPRGVHFADAARHDTAVRSWFDRFLRSWLDNGEGDQKKRDG